MVEYILSIYQPPPPFVQGFCWGDFQYHIFKKRGSEKIECLGDLKVCERLCKIKYGF